MKYKKFDSTQNDGEIATAAHREHVEKNPDLLKKNISTSEKGINDYFEINDVGIGAEFVFKTAFDAARKADELCLTLVIERSQNKVLSITKKNGTWIREDGASLIDVQHQIDIKRFDSIADRSSIRSDMGQLISEEYDRKLATIDLYEFEYIHNILLKQLAADTIAKNAELFPLYRKKIENIRGVINEKMESEKVVRDIDEEISNIENLVENLSERMNKVDSDWEATSYFAEETRRFLEKFDKETDPQKKDVYISSKRELSEFTSRSDECKKEMDELRDLRSNMYSLIKDANRVKDYAVYLVEDSRREIMKASEDTYIGKDERTQFAIEIGVNNSRVYIDISQALKACGDFDKMESTEVKRIAESLFEKYTSIKSIQAETTEPELSHLDVGVSANGIVDDHPVELTDSSYGSSKASAEETEVKLPNSELTNRVDTGITADNMTDREKLNVIYSNRDQLVMARETGTLTPEVERQHAQRDATLLTTISTEAERFFAAVEVGENTDEFPEYRKEIERIAPNLTQEARVAVAESDRRSAAKEDRKIADMKAMQTYMAVRPDIYSFVTDSTEFYRWYEYGGKPRPEPLTKETLEKLGHDMFASLAFTEQEWSQFKKEKLGKLQSPIAMLQKITSSNVEVGPAWKNARNIADWTSTNKTPSPVNVRDAMGQLLIRAEFEAVVGGASLPTWYGELTEARSSIERSYASEIDVTNKSYLSYEDMIIVMQNLMPIAAKQLNAAGENEFLSHVLDPSRIEKTSNNLNWEKEQENRILNLSKLQNTSGASYTFWQHAIEAVDVSETPDKVDWDLVAYRTILESIAEHGQPPDHVADTVCKHSPGAVTPTAQAAIRDLIMRATPQLQARFERFQSIEISKDNNINQI